MNYRFATLACAALGLSASLLTSACSSASQTLVSTGASKVTRGELDAKLEAMPVAHQLLKSMLQQDLVFEWAAAHNVTATDAEVDAKINEIKQRLTDQQLADALKQQGMTQQDLRDLMKEQILVKKAVDQNIKISDAQMKDYLDKNHALLDQPKQVRARHILVATEALAAQIEAKLKAGGDFAALAKQYSSDPGTKDKGGELGFFTQGSMVKEFSDVAFAAKPGQISAPVHSPYGWHIIQVEEVKPAMVATLANSAPKIRDQMMSTQEQTLVPQFMDNLMQTAKVTVGDPAFADVVPTPLPTFAPVPTAAPTKK